MWTMSVTSFAALCLIPLLCADDNEFTFHQAPTEGPIFPELFQPGRRAVLLAIDPDLGGAVAALSWLNPPAPAGAAEDCSSNGSAAAAAQGSLPPLDQIAVELHDMPVEVWKYGSRDKKQPDAAKLIVILQRYVDAVQAGSALWHDLGGSSGAQGAEPAPANMAGSRRRNRSSNASPNAAVVVGQLTEEEDLAAAGASLTGISAAIVASEAAGEPAPVLRAVMEYSMPTHVSGKFAWFGIGFASGLLNGLLAAQGIPYHRVAGQACTC